jgi:hypothetical protein
MDDQRLGWKGGSKKRVESRKTGWEGGYRSLFPLFFYIRGDIREDIHLPTTPSTTRFGRLEAAFMFGENSGGAIAEAMGAEPPVRSTGFALQTLKKVPSGGNPGFPPDPHPGVYAVHQSSLQTS